MISKELFCKALRMIVEQEEINRRFAEALQLVGNGIQILMVASMKKERRNLVIHTIRIFKGGKQHQK